MVQVAAQIGAEFRMDPVFVLEERDEFKTAVRVAALTYNSKQRAKQARAAQKGQ